MLAGAHRDVFPASASSEFVHRPSSNANDIRLSSFSSVQPVCPTQTLSTAVNASRTVLPLVLSDIPSIHGGDGVSFVTSYTLNKFYQLSGMHASIATVPSDAPVVSCTDVARFVTQFRYWTLQRL